MPCRFFRPTSWSEKSTWGRQSELWRMNAVAFFFGKAPKFVHRGDTEIVSGAHVLTVSPTLAAGISLSVHRERRRAHHDEHITLRPPGRVSVRWLQGRAGHDMLAADPQVLVDSGVLDRGAARELPTGAHESAAVICSSRRRNPDCRPWLGRPPLAPLPCRQASDSCTRPWRSFPPSTNQRTSGQMGRRPWRP
jgi:hypothetical protein